MILIITGTQDATADYLLPFLVRSGFACLRLDTDTLLSRSCFSYEAGIPVIEWEGCRHSPEVFSNVWYRRPERLEDERFSGSPEGQYVLDEWAAALEGFLAHIPKARWMNHPSCNAAASRKLEQLSTAQILGLRVPDTLLTQNESKLRKFFADHNGRVVVKPLSTGYIKRSGEQTDSLIYSNLVPEAFLHSLEDLSLCPTLFQQFIDKKSDVRITVVDEDMIAVELCGLDDNGVQLCDIRRNNMKGVSYSRVPLPPDVQSSLAALVRNYGLRFAAIDMVVSRDGEWYFLEVNPNGQWAWLDLALGPRIAESFVKAFSERRE
ncbi:MAG: hypothetical protein WC655_12690 [Candidatus Hydrogenedentales bacterium]|jgi:glutathione synthase/RimK-type ligase-like ATP-grasp enzyme